MLIKLKDVPLGSTIRYHWHGVLREFIVVAKGTTEPNAQALLATKAEIAGMTRASYVHDFGLAYSDETVEDIFEHKWLAGWYSFHICVELVTKAVVDANKKCSDCQVPMPHTAESSCAFCEVGNLL